MYTKSPAEPHANQKLLSFCISNLKSAQIREKTKNIDKPIVIKNCFEPKQKKNNHLDLSKLHNFDVF